MRRPIIAGNWKMFKTPGEALSLINDLKSLISHVQAEIVVCPPFVDLPAVVVAVQDTGIKVGAQNMHWEQEGAFTGEVSPVMLAAVGCQYVIIGHSERRQYFFETDEAVNRKVKAALAHGLRPIVCVGETLAQREAGMTGTVVENQVRTGLTGLPQEGRENLVLAYEPVWAIGTGKNASAADAETVIAQIRALLADMFGAETAAKIRIQYGGSVKPENIQELMAQPNIDGALVGGASLKADSFSKIAGF
ncbi:triose-phosphate isomerase [Candidatus Formimonas warabiya]|uniref:Triosephosphate isomerase n=1 Tax=Formimonas warabiya TaxID=1761012 RepID=A0A3G1KTP6_FORW1|nr:triose-phosphate isomerase [Candidatus Formimonas warabiya]ATW25829.1 triose-phosphate isomerase [Candidatus Formimonas warabiya]